MQTNPRDAYNSDTFQADCENCFGLCCVALGFTASVDFSIDKAGGVPCRNLEEDCHCGIHPNLGTLGYNGCTVFDCLGAGQKVSQQTFGGISWKNNPQSAQQMFQMLPVMQQLHEMMLYLTQAIDRYGKGELETELRKSRQAIYGLTLATAEKVLATDLPQYRQDINDILVQGSGSVRLESGRYNKKMNRKKGADYQEADLIGEKFQERDMKGSLFRGTYLIGADLRNADLRNSDFIGANLRNADLSGADLSGSLYLTQMQLNAARGNTGTKLPGLLSRPTHWHKD